MDAGSGTTPFQPQAPPPATLTSGQLLTRKGTPGGLREVKVKTLVKVGDGFRV